MAKKYIITKDRIPYMPSEKEVENFFWKNFQDSAENTLDSKKVSIIGADRDSKSKTDGILEIEMNNGKNLEVLCEFKYNLNFKDTQKSYKVLVQALQYLYQIKESKGTIPSVVFVADDNEYFLLSSKYFDKYLREPEKWELSLKTTPSKSYLTYSKILEDMYNRTTPRIIINYRENGYIDFYEILNMIKTISNKMDSSYKLNKESIQKAYGLFTKHVIMDDYSSHETIKLFLTCINEYTQDDVYLHPKKLNMLVLDGYKTDFKINTDAFNMFINIYQTAYGTDEFSELKRIIDSLITEEERRRQGAYFTPKVFVDYAHDMISKNLNEYDEEGNLVGNDWKEDYVVWDPACGTKNLTRDYKFKELYLSTLETIELDMSANLNIAHKHNTFQYDFLNDDWKPVRSGGKVPDGLFDAVEDKNKKVLILMNPPYGTSTDRKNIEGRHKAGITGDLDSKLKKRMKYLKFDRACHDLYTMFYFRLTEYILNNKQNKQIAMFSPSRHLRTKGNREFRNYMSSYTNMYDSITFDSKHFEGSAGGWDIMFSISKINQKQKTPIINAVIELDNDGNIYNLIDQEMYCPTEEYELQNWIKDVKNYKTIRPNITLTNAVTLKKVNPKSGSTYKDGSLGYFVNGGSNIEKNGELVFMLSVGFSNGNGVAINDKNIYKASVAFASRKLILKTFFNCKDEYSKPDIAKSIYEEYKKDSLIFSLFNMSSLQSSLRNVGYDKDGNPVNCSSGGSDPHYIPGQPIESIDVKNEWFFLSNEEMKQLSNGIFDELYLDAKDKPDSFIYQEIRKLEEANQLSREALKVLNIGRDLVRSTIGLRRELYRSGGDNLMYHLQAWDAGYWQIRKAVDLTEDDPRYKLQRKILADLKIAFKELSDKMRPLVYELGMLKNSPYEKDKTK